MKRKNGKKNSWLIVSLVLLGICFLGISAFAKYIQNEVEDGPAKAVEMFFSSDVLQTKESANQTYQILSKSSSDKNIMSFELRNYPDTLRYTNRDILYQLTANDSHVSFAVGNGVGSLGEIPASTNSSEQQTQIIHVSLAEGFWAGGVTEKKVTITAEATAPYQTTLSATFLIKKQTAGYRLTVEDDVDNSYAIVTIKADASQDLLLNWDNDLVVPDQTNACFESGVTNAGPFSAQLKLKTIPAGGSVTFYLFKFDETQDYTDYLKQNVFTVE